MGFLAEKRVLITGLLSNRSIAYGVAKAARREGAELAALFPELGKKWNALAGLVHAIAFAPREAITGDFLVGLSREAFRIAHDVSSYSFAALAKAALPL